MAELRVIPEDYLDCISVANMRESDRLRAARAMVFDCSLQKPRSEEVK